MSSPKSDPTSVRLFYSYAHKDEALRDELQTHLSLLKRQGILHDWHDRAISAGWEWEGAIDKNLEAADVILLLVSADFLASDYCYDKEMQRALEKHEAGKARVIPVIIRPVDWSSAPFRKLQPLPKDAKPVTSWSNSDEAWTDVARGIRKAVEELMANHSIVSLTPHNTQSEGLWNVPPHNPFFTGRENALKQLHDTLTSGATAALSQPQAISGLGGIGKTQTAIEYAHKYRNEYQAGGLWTRADSHEMLVSGFVALASLLNLPEKDSQDQNLAVTAVKRWLETKTDWLLILDSADDLMMVREFIPSRGKGHVLLTTRAQAMSGIAQRIEIKKMEPKEGALFLLRRATVIAKDALLEQASDADRVLAEEISTVMDGLPLALDQAGAFIEETPSTLAEYLNLYKTEGTALRAKRGDLAFGHPESVTITFSLSFAKVAAANQAAADLLRLCAFFDPDTIPEEIIHKGAPDLGEIIGSAVVRPLELATVLKEACRFSLLRRDPTAKTLDIHRLVQAVLKDDMDTDTERRWADRAVRAVNRAFPDVDFSVWPRCERLLSHARTCMELIEKWNLEFPEAARLLDQTALYLYKRARYTEAEPLYQKALAIRKKALGQDHLDVAVSLNNLAGLYHAQGKYDEAERCYQRSLEIRKDKLNPQHPYIAVSLNNLAALYNTQRKYTHAEPLAQQALAISEKELGPDHPEGAVILNTLAEICRNQCKYPAAEPLYQRALAIKEKALGSNHPEVAQILNNLALLYDDQRKYAEAEPLYRRALAIKEKALGHEHLSVATSLNNLAAHYHAQGKHAQVESLYLRALTIVERGLGSSHLTMAISLDNLTMFYYDQGRYPEAELLGKRALEIRQEVLGSKHHDVTNSLLRLAMLYNAQGKYDEAEALSLNDLALEYLNEGKYAEAEPLFREALAIREKALGPENHRVATSLNNLGGLYYAQGRYPEAEPLFRRALAISKKVLEPTHYLVATSLNNLVGLYYHKRKYDQAALFLRQILVIRESELGPDHLRVAEDLEKYADLLKKAKKKGKAARVEARAKAIRTKHVQ